MLTKIKVYILRALGYYHSKLADYYFGKIDEYGPENNEYYAVKVTEHVNKECKLFQKRIALITKGDLASAGSSFIFASVSEWHTKLT